VLTRPFEKYKPGFVVSLPPGEFSFRPLYIQDVYMALKIWEPYLRKTLQSLLVPGSVFIDVGAHIGYYTVFASKTVGLNGSVIAIEPDERNCRLLYKNCGHLKNVLIHQAAAGVKDGTVYLKCMQNPLFNEVANQEEPMDLICKKVDCITLDSLKSLVKEKKPLSVIVKIDVENGDIEVLQGGLELLAAIHPVLIIEVVHAHEIEAILKRFGYKSRQLFGSYWLFTEDDSEPSQIPTPAEQSTTCQQPEIVNR
jgi:FkbM family methyltransferase